MFDTEARAIYGPGMTRKSRMLTAAEVAERLNTTADTVREWARTDKITHSTLPNGRYRFPERIVAEIEAGHEVAA